MKRFLLAILIVLPLRAVAGEATVGDTLDRVYSAMGVPRGQLHVGRLDTLYYDRGIVELESGIVKHVALRSAQEQAAFEAKRLAEIIRVSEKRVRLIAEGEAVKVGKLADASFLAMPPGYQVSYWENFSRRYSEVSCKEQLAQARLNLAVQVADARIRAAEAQRVADQEKLAADARTHDTIYSYDISFQYGVEGGRYDSVYNGRTNGNCR